MPRAARTAVTVVFFASGAAYGTFVSRIPALKEKLDASESELGLVLLAGAVGSVLTLPLAGWLSGRVGSRLVTRAALVAVAVSLPLLAIAPSLAVFALVFALFGACTSTLDLAMNAHGVAVEERYARPIFSSFHASWSVGGLVAAGVGGAAAARGVSPQEQFSGVALGIAAIFAWSSRELLPREADARPADSGYRRPSPALLALAALAFAGLLAEGAAADWSGVYLDESVGTSEAVATAGFAAFAATMIGFACLGLGLATVVPTVFRAAGRRASSPGVGIAAVSTVGYSAFLVGPPAIGFLAEAIGLRAALGIVVVLCALIAAFAGATRVA
jgi:MFS family permease